MSTALTVQGSTVPVSHVTIGTTISGADAWLAPDAAASYQAMRAAGMPAGGITSAGRSSTEQSALYQAYLAGKGNLAAKPGTSMHEAGEALDMNLVSRAYQWLTTNGAKYGWTQAVSGEPWHWQHGGSTTATKSDVPLIGGLIDGATNLAGTIASTVTGAASSALGLNDIASTATSVLLRIVFVVGGVGLITLGLARMVAPKAASLATTLGGAS